MEVMTESRMFAKYGHKCQITNIPPELYMFAKAHTRFKRFKNFLIRFRMASDLNTRAHKFFHSEYAFFLDHYVHLKHLHIIHPFSDFRLYWDFMMIVVFHFKFLVLPFEMALYRRRETRFIGVFIQFHMLLDLLCLVDVCLNFFTGYCDNSKKEVILDPKKIQVNYLKSYFIPDVLSSFCTFTDLFVETYRRKSNIILVLKAFAFIKYCRVFTVIRYCSDFAEYFDVTNSKYNIFMIVTCYLSYVHIITCTNMFFGNAKPHGVEIINNIWRKEDYSQKPVLEDYAMHVYRALLIIANMDFGLTPWGESIKIYVMVIWILSRIIYIFLIAEIMKLVITKRSANIKYIEMVRQLKEYMRYKQIPENMQKRLLGYYEFRFQKSYFRESEILTTISGHLRQEIVLHSCKKLVEHVDFLKDLPMTLLVRIVSCLKCEVFLVNDVIFRSNSPGYCMYFIAAGSVAIYSPKGDEVCHLHDGEYFGEIALLMVGTKRVASIVAVEICELYRLDRKDFIKAVMPYPRLVEKIFNIAETRLEATQTLDKRNAWRNFQQ